MILSSGTQSKGGIVSMDPSSYESALDMQFSMTKDALEQYDRDVNVKFMHYEPLHEQMMDLTCASTPVVPTNISEFINIVRRAKRWACDDNDYGDNDDNSHPVEKANLEKYFGIYKTELNGTLVAVLQKEAEERLEFYRRVQRKRSAEILAKNYAIILIYERALEAKRKETITKTYDLSVAPSEPLAIPFEPRVLDRGNAILSFNIAKGKRDYKDEYVKYAKKRHTPVTVDMTASEEDINISESVAASTNAANSDPYERDSSDDDQQTKKNKFLELMVRIKVVDKKTLFHPKPCPGVSTVTSAHLPMSVLATKHSRSPDSSGISARGAAGYIEAPALFVGTIVRNPLSSTWCKIRRNFYTDNRQNDVLEYMPFFGDDDESNIFDEAGSASIYEVTPDLAPFDIMGEAEENCVLHMIEKHKYKEFGGAALGGDAIYQDHLVGICGELLVALHNVLHIDKSEILSAYRRMAERALVLDSHRRYPQTKIEMDRGAAGIWGGERLLPLLGPGHIVRSHIEADLVSSSVAFSRENAIEATATAGPLKDNLLGLRSSGDFAEVNSNFRDLFCRRCYLYDCHTHGIRQVVPRECRDPVMLFIDPLPGESIEQYWTRTLGKASGSKKSVSKASGGGNGNGGSPPTPLSTYFGQGQALVETTSQDRLSCASGRRGSRQSFYEQFTSDSIVDKVLAASRGSINSVDMGGIGSTPSPPGSPRSAQESRNSLTVTAVPPLLPLLYSDLATEAVSASERAVIIKLAVICGLDSYVQIAELIGTRSEREIEYILREHYETDEYKAWAHTNILLCRETAPRGNFGENRASKKGTLKNNAQYKDRMVVGHQHRTMYESCDHDGECRADNGACLCVTNKTYCDKYCGCNKDECPQFFRGCSCMPGGKSTCKTGTCPCFVAFRECDPDLCLSCGACVHPAVREKVERSLDTPSSHVDISTLEEDSLVAIEAVVRSKSGGGGGDGGFTGNTTLDGREKLAVKRLELCANTPTQLSRSKLTKVAHSTIHGWGLFLLEPAKKGDYIMEYVGELISHDDAERRGVVYDKRNISYLFDINSYYTIDSMNIGNNTKYINHSTDPNCEIKILYVKGDHRICVFARRSIEAGDELTFNYWYDRTVADEGASSKFRGHVPSWHKRNRGAEPEAAARNKKSRKKDAG